MGLLYPPQIFVLLLPANCIYGYEMREMHAEPGTHKTGCMGSAGVMIPATVGFTITIKLPSKQTPEVNLEAA
jgi:hypothetical protein